MSYEATHHFSGGGSVSGPAWVADAAARVDRTMVEEQREWVAQLRGLGVKLAHPDDGWVNRNRHTPQPCYPQMHGRPEVGDLIALGWPFDDTRVVRVTAVDQRPPLIGVLGPIVTYSFDPEPVHIVPRPERPAS